MISLDAVAVVMLDGWMLTKTPSYCIIYNMGCNNGVLAGKVKIVHRGSTILIGFFSVVVAKALTNAMLRLDLFGTNDREKIH